MPTKPKTTATEEEPLEQIPTGHPNAGYTSPDLSGITGIERLSDEEQEHYDEQTAAQQEEAEAIADAEDAFVKAQKEEADDKAKADEKASKAEASTSQSSTASSSKS